MPCGHTEVRLYGSTQRKICLIFLTSDFKLANESIMNTIAGYNTNNTYMTGMMNTGQNAVMQAMQGGDMNSIFAGILGGTIDNIANAASEGASDTGKTLIQLGASIIKMLMAYMIGQAKNEVNATKAKADKINKLALQGNQEVKNETQRIISLEDSKIQARQAEAQQHMDNILAGNESMREKMSIYEGLEGLTMQQCTDAQAQIEQLTQEKTQKEQDLRQKQQELTQTIQKKKQDLLPQQRQEAINNARTAAREQFEQEHPDLAAQLSMQNGGELSDSDIGFNENSVVFDINNVVFDETTDSDCQKIQTDITTLETRLSTISQELVQQTNMIGDACAQLNGERDSLFNYMSEQNHLNEEQRGAISTILDQVQQGQITKQQAIEQMTTQLSQFNSAANNIENGLMAEQLVNVATDQGIATAAHAKAVKDAATGQEGEAAKDEQIAGDATGGANLGNQHHGTQQADFTAFQSFRTQIGGNITNGLGVSMNFGNEIYGTINQWLQSAPGPMEFQFNDMGNLVPNKRDPDAVPS